MSWIAVVPLKATGMRKTRLAGLLSPSERHRLSLQMFDHVIEALQQCPGIKDIVTVSDRPATAGMTRWIDDEGMGLNAGLAKARDTLHGQSLLVVHGDLPLLSIIDLRAMIATAEEQGVAVAPDSHGLGTNAIALRDASGFDFAFGPDSLRRHLAALGPATPLVQRVGVSLDIDTPHDLARAQQRGFFFSSA